MDQQEQIEHSTNYVFKPLDVDCDDDFDFEERLTSIDIFQDVETQPVEELLLQSQLVSMVNPILKLQSPFLEHLDDDIQQICHRVISPYPFSHTSREEIQEREELTNSIGWGLTSDEDGQDNQSKSIDCNNKCSNNDTTKITVEVDYSKFFNHIAVNGEDLAPMECDDFSLSSHEANSFVDDDIFGTISEDPASFWEEGIVQNTSGRSSSPTQVSLGSDVHQGP